MQTFSLRPILYPVNTLNTTKLTRNDSEKKLVFCGDGWRTEISYFFTFKHERNRKFDFFRCKIDFISLMNTKSGIFTRGFATRENTAFGVHSMK